MKWNIAAVTFVIWFMCGCANWGGNNPVGVTGGSDQGYGQSGDLNLPSTGSESASQLVGSWRYDHDRGEYEIIEFKSNGRYSFRYYENGEYIIGISGNYTVSGNTLTIWYEGEMSMMNFEVDDDSLTLYRGGEVITYYRI